MGDDLERSLDGDGELSAGTVSLHHSPYRHFLSGLLSRKERQKRYGYRSEHSQSANGQHFRQSD